MVIRKGQTGRLQRAARNSSPGPGHTIADDDCLAILRAICPSSASRTYDTLPPGSQTTMLGVLKQFLLNRFAFLATASINVHEMTL